MAKGSTRAGLSPDRGRCDGFSIAESSKIKIWTSSRKKLIRPQFCFSQLYSTRGTSMRGCSMIPRFHRSSFVGSCVIPGTQVLNLVTRVTKFNSSTAIGKQVLWSQNHQNQNQKSGTFYLIYLNFLII